MISPIGNSYGYYTSSPYATGHTAAAARTALLNSNHDVSLEVQAVADVPEVFSNEETERVERTPSQQAQDRLNAYEMMNSLNFRNAEHLNAPLEFMTRKPFEPDFFHNTNNRKNGYETHQNSYQAYTHTNRGFYATA